MNEMSLSGWIATISLLPLIAVLIMGDRLLHGWAAVVGRILAWALIAMFFAALVLVEAITP